ncbi:MAG: hypothetical protein IPM38_14810 [Ignavibacteria bacterium]|nr:hypothetical protein [Ignavibacteria bacterium]
MFQKNFGVYNDMIITEMRIINRSDQPWTKCYMALWTDDDLGVASDDAVGCDTNLNLGFTYNFTNNDGEYGLAPPAVGFLLLQGQTIPSAGDTVKYYSPLLSNNLLIRPGYKDLGMTAFNMYTNGNPSVGDPSNYREAYFNLQGIRRTGLPWINPVTNQITKFAFPGDPFTQTGWNEADAGNRRFIMSSGPSTINPGDTQTIIFAQVISRSASNLASVNSLKYLSKQLKRLYDYNFNISVAADPPEVEHYSSGNGKIYLTLNDEAERKKYFNAYSDTYFEFQGYNVYQIKSYTNNPVQSDTVLIKTFDIIDGIKDIRDSIYLNEYEGFIFGVVQRGSDNGISRNIELDKDTISNRNFINGTEYKFAVSAYYYDPSGGPFTLPKVLHSPKKIIKVIPQNISAGTQVNYLMSDTILTDQRDLGVMPIIIDPVKLLNATYTSVFGMFENKLSWTLTRNYNGSSAVLFQNVHDFTGTQDTAKSADGLLLIHQAIRDSGVVRDPDDNYRISNNIPTYSLQKGWTYEPQENIWFRGPDTAAIMSAKLITQRQFDSRSLGISFPTQGRFNNFRSRITANGKQFTEGTGTNTLMAGGPLRKVQFVFGETSKAYRYAPASNVLLTDTNLIVTPYRDMTDVPFAVYSVDELDSSGGAPRRLNIAFVDADADGIWNPDESKLGKYQFTYIFDIYYSETPESKV